MDSLPVVAVRLLDGRVGSTLLMQLLATSNSVLLERTYPEGERRYLSYCLRLANWIGTAWDPETHPDVSQFFFGSPDRGGPLPFEASLVDIHRLAPAALAHLWQAMSEELRRANPEARYYSEKLVGSAEVLFNSAISLHLIDLVRDPRDVFCSIRALTAETSGFGRVAGQSEADFLATMANSHLQRLRDMAATPATVRHKIIRYEDLVADLHAEAEHLGRWLDLQLDAQQVLSRAGNYRHHMTSASAAESVGRWRRDLPRELADSLWERLGPMLEPLGYQAD